jgi:hypothetical protein
MSIDRRTILSSSLAWAAITLSGCSDHGSSGGTNGTGGMGASGTGGGTGAGGTAATGGTDGGGSGGMDASGGTTCSETMTGDHMHPLTIPGSDADRGYQDAPYELEDGGTGHTHTLTLSAYDFAYLQAGVSRMVDSSTTLDHLHTVTIVCTRPV